MWCVCPVMMHINYFLFRDLHSYLIGGVVMNIITFLMIYVSTVRVTQYNVASIHEQGLPPSLSMIPSTTSSRISTIPPLAKHNPGTITVDMMLSDEALIHAFMVHLSQEYSMEILSSYIEFTQFQKYIARTDDP